MMVVQLLRDETGTVRAYWRLFIVAFSVLALIILNRLILRGVGLLNDTIESQMASGIMDSMAVAGLVYVLTIKLERRDFSLAEIGLAWKPTVLIFFGGGVIVGGILELLSLRLGIALGIVEAPMMPSFNPITVLIGTTAAMLNSFWQEMAFRGYLQMRFVESYGANIGIPVVAIFFVLFHLLVSPLSALEVLTGSILFLLVGLLYHLSRSLYFVVALHGILNYLPAFWGTGWSQPLNRAIVYGLALGLVLLFTQVSRLQGTK
jgi:membrane protease YdiL (CAAX protease family)